MHKVLKCGVNHGERAKQVFIDNYSTYMKNSKIAARKAKKPSKATCLCHLVKIGNLNFVTDIGSVLYCSR